MSNADLEDDMKLRVASAPPPKWREPAASDRAWPLTVDLFRKHPGA